MRKISYLKQSLVLLIMSCMLLFACKSSDRDTPSKAEMEVILHASIVSIKDESMEVVISEDGVKSDMIYTVSIENCEFHIDRDVLSEDYPILIVPSEIFDKSDDSFEALKVYGLKN